MDCLDKFAIEFTIKKNRYNLANAPQWLLNIIKEYKQYEGEDRLIITVPREWNGFRDGTIVSMFKELGEAVYIALAYITMGDEIVTDFDGNTVDKYTVGVNGVQKNKYVKKKIRIVNVYDTEKAIFQVQDYLLDFSYIDCIVKVLDVYCVGTRSKFRLTDFIKEEKNGTYVKS